MGYHYSTDIVANFKYKFYLDAALQNLHVSNNDSIVWLQYRFTDIVHI